MARPTRFSAVLGALLLGGGAGLVLALLLQGRRMLREAQARLDPDSDTTHLQRTRRWHPDPDRRRQAALLLHAAEADATSRWNLLRGQGWGRAPLAAVVLKLQAQEARRLGWPEAAQVRWRRIDRHFPRSPARADALYWLGREDPQRIPTLLEEFAAHPAALAAALELGDAPETRLSGARHLSRWGVGWPGAAALIRRTCLPEGRSEDAADAGDAPAELRPALRRELAAGLARAGLVDAAETCLAGAAPDAALRLARARRDLWGGREAERRAEEALLQLARDAPGTPEAEEAVRLLAAATDTTDLLERLPASLRQSAPVAAHRALAARGEGAEDVLARWPGDPAGWEMAWELARRSLLKGDWSGSQRWLDALDPLPLPAPQRARQRFWLAISHQRQQRPGQAEQLWRELLESDGWGYYGWRAAERLGIATLPDLSAPQDLPPPAPWEPLASGDRRVDELWRLGQTLEAWETWRLGRGEPRRYSDLGPLSQEEARNRLVEGRLRLGIGDDWRGLAVLDAARLRLLSSGCPDRSLLERSRHPIRRGAIFREVGESQGLNPLLLLAVAHQESRFSAGVGSVAGAIGLMQLMPATAAELHGAALTREQLSDPALSARLGARYLAQLLEQWQGRAIPAVASYNAGPGAVQGWVDARLERFPELWIEDIPYPETRLYVKKVLGNVWSYARLEEPDPCS